MIVTRSFLIASPSPGVALRDHVSAGTWAAAPREPALEHRKVLIAIRLRAERLS
jgi:hypothetical protein